MEANQARTHTADSETKQFLFQPRCPGTLLSAFLPSSSTGFLLPRQSSYTLEFLRSRREKGSFPRDNDRRVLREEHPSRFRSDGMAAKKEYSRGKGRPREGKRRKEREEDVSRQKPANRQERETIAISASVHGVQRRRNART